MASRTAECADRPVQSTGLRGKATYLQQIHGTRPWMSPRGHSALLEAHNSSAARLGLPVSRPSRAPFDQKQQPASSSEPRSLSGEVAVWFRATVPNEHQPGSPSSVEPRRPPPHRTRRCPSRVAGPDDASARPQRHPWRSCAVKVTQRRARVHQACAKNSAELSRLGYNDPRVRAGGAEQIVKAVRARGKDVCTCSG